MLQASGRFVVGSSLAWATACATTQKEPAPGSAERPSEGSHRVVHPWVAVTAGPDVALEDQRWVDDALPDALARLRVFSLTLTSRVELRLHGTRRSFVEATGRSAGWLRAWAGYDVIHLLPPRAWRDASAPARVERLAHELTHAATFQSLGDEAAARRVRPPFWFREGAASVVAEQEARRMPLSFLVERAGATDPVVDAEGWLGRDHDVAYAAAHHAVALLVERHGAGVLAAILGEARRDGDEGAIDRAVRKVCDLHLRDLWTRVRAGALARGDEGAAAL